MLAHTCDPSTWEDEVEVCEAQVILGCIVGTCLKKCKVFFNKAVWNNRSEVIMSQDT